MKRHIIQTNGKTTANCTVQARSTTLGLNDQRIANEGDDVSCPACHSISKIRCCGARVPMTGSDSRRVALTDDLGICKCDPMLKLVAPQQAMSVDA